MRLALPLISPVLLRHCETAALLQAGRPPALPQKSISAVLWVLPDVITPFTPLRHAALLQRGIHSTITYAYSALTFNTVLSPPLFSLDEEAPLCMQ